MGWNHQLEKNSRLTGPKPFNKLSRKQLPSLEVLGMEGRDLALSEELGFKVPIRRGQPGQFWWWENGYKI